MANQTTPVLVRWIDSQKLEGFFQFTDDFTDFKPLTCETVGFLVHADDTKIVTAQEVWQDKMGMKYIHVIPRNCVLEITELGPKQ